MGGRTTRRGILKLMAGSAVALPFTPLPWKLLGDTAIWTQTGDHIARLPRGEISTQFTTCTLCPAGCAVRARCVAGVPVGLSGVAGHPLGYGSLCPLGPGAHQLSHHPHRLAGPVVRSTTPAESFAPVPARKAVAALSAAIRATDGGATSVAVLDARPGRALSALYQRFLGELPDGAYLTCPSGGNAWWQRLDQMLDGPCGPMGYDLERTQTILSFGAPILDGWGAPGRALRTAFARTDRRPQLYHVETRPSRTAGFADHWLAPKPGTEGALALGLAHVIVGEKLHDAAGLGHADDFDTGDRGDYRHLIASFPPERVGRITGIRPDDVVATARAFGAGGPALAVGEGDPGGGPLGRETEVAIWGLNLLVGSVGRDGGVVPIRGLPSRPELETANATSAAAVEPACLTDMPDRSLRVLILDAAASGGALPWPAIERKLAGPDALVVSLSPYLIGHARHARYVIPAPRWLEGFEEAPTPPGAGRASLAVSAPRHPTPEGATDPADLLHQLAAALDVSPLGEGGSRTLIGNRVTALREAARGQVYDPADGSLTPMGNWSAAALWERLCGGDLWLDDAPQAAPPSRFSLLSPGAVGFERLAALAEGPPTPQNPARDKRPAVLMPYALRGTAGEGPVPPLASKLYRESDLREGPGVLTISPETARLLGLTDGGHVRVETGSGRFEARVTLDPAVLPDVIHAAVGPDPDRLGGSGDGIGQHILSICLGDEGETWRATAARIWKV